MNRKGEEIGKTMTIVVVMIILFVLMGLFDVAAYYTSLTKGQSNSVATSVNAREDILTRPINISGNQELVSEYMIKQYLNGNKFDSAEFDSQIENIMVNDPSFSSKSSCVFFTIGEFQNYGSNLAFYYLGNSNLYESVFLYKDSTGKITPYNDLDKINSLLGIDKLSASAIQIPIGINEKNFLVISYYGGCQ